jgi:hypothetical protein
MQLEDFGGADMRCMSDECLAEELGMEFRDKNTLSG